MKPKRGEEKKDFKRGGGGKLGQGVGALKRRGGGLEPPYELYLNISVFPVVHGDLLYQKPFESLQRFQKHVTVINLVSNSIGEMSQSMSGRLFLPKTKLK